MDTVVHSLKKVVQLARTMLWTPLRALVLGFYNALLRPLVEPWRSIVGRQFQFLTWFTVVILLGLVASCLPLLLLVGRDQIPQGGVRSVFHTQLSTGTLGTFFVPVLAEGLVGLLLMEKAGQNITSAGVRGFVGALTVLLLFVTVSVVGAEGVIGPGSDRAHISPNIHLGLAIISIPLAAYLYCFRIPGWEERVPSVEAVTAKQDAEVKNLAITAAAQSKEGDVAL